jgi:CheY-like chemotaxis protein
MNLVSNAFEATSPGDRVTVSTSAVRLDHPRLGYELVRPGHYVVLQVQDSGAGIAPEDLGRIFEPFYTNKEMGHSGTGLGLAIVHGVVRDHHGSIDVQTAVGRGASSYIYFPTTEASDDQIPSDRGWLFGNEKVLVIDDLSEQRDLAVRILESLGYTAHAADSGQSALAYLQDNAVDIIVLDMVMEDEMDGLDTYRQIPSSTRTRKRLLPAALRKQIV